MMSSDGSVSARTMFVKEINLPSGVGRGMYKLEVVDEGAVLNSKLNGRDICSNHVCFMRSD